MSSRVCCGCGRKSFSEPSDALLAQCRDCEYIERLAIDVINNVHRLREVCTSCGGNGDNLYSSRLLYRAEPFITNNTCPMCLRTIINRYDYHHHIPPASDSKEVDEPPAVCTEEPSEGDERLADIRKTLESFPVQRVPYSQAFHDRFIRSCLPTDTATESDQLKAQLEALQLPMNDHYKRKEATAMLVAALMKSVPGVKIEVTPTTNRASSDFAEKVKKYLEMELPSDIEPTGAIDHIVKKYVDTKPVNSDSDDLPDLI